MAVCQEVYKYDEHGKRSHLLIIVIMGRKGLI